MAFGKTRSNLQAEIDDQKDFIQECLEEVSVLLDKRNSEVERMITIQAKEEAQGDAEIESSIISNYMYILIANPQKKVMFLNAMMLMAYSYYETYYKKMAKMCGKDAKSFHEIYDDKITSETGDKINTIIYQLKEVRNFLSHGDSKASEEQIGVVTSLEKSRGDITIKDGQVEVQESFINWALNLFHDSLSEIAKVVDVFRLSNKCKNVF